MMMRKAMLGMGMGLAWAMFATVAGAQQAPEMVESVLASLSFTGARADADVAGVRTA